MSRLFWFLKIWKSTSITVRAHSLENVRSVILYAQRAVYNMLQSKREHCPRANSYMGVCAQIGVWARRIVVWTHTAMHYAVAPSHTQGLIPGDKSPKAYSCFWHQLLAPKADNILSSLVCHGKSRARMRAIYASCTYATSRNPSPKSRALLCR